MKSNRSSKLSGIIKKVKGSNHFEETIMFSSELTVTIDTSTIPEKLRTFVHQAATELIEAGTYAITKAKQAKGTFELELEGDMKVLFEFYPPVRNKRAEFIAFQVAQ